MAIVPGSVIGGDFRVVSRLSEGGMGTVWVAEQLSVGRKRALKVMRSEILHEPSLRERFVLEAKVGATIHSDHVVEVVAAGIDEALGVPWLAMELLDGQDLAARIAERGALARVDVLEIVDQLCHALAAAHAAGVVHRDLKPENIFLARSRRSGGAALDVKVLDFGIAKVAADARATTATSGLLGTPLYMAPEQADRVGAAAPTIDVWALGLVVYRMLTGRFFWRSTHPATASITALLREVLIDPIPSASARAMEDGVGALLPTGFDAWLARCLERDASNRFRDAGDAFTALSAVLRASASPFAATMPSLRPEPRAAVKLAATTPRAAMIAVHDDESLKLGRIVDIVVVHWRASPTAASVATMDRALTRAIHALGGPPCHVMPIVETRFESPPPDVRDAFARCMEQQDRSVRSVAYVVLGEGFQAAATRGVITGLTLLARPTHATRVYATIAEAVAATFARFAPPSSSGATATEVSDAIARFAAVSP